MKNVIKTIHDIPINDGISKYITLKKKGVNFQAPCPFHNEKTASFSVSPQKGIFKCFGCGESGDLIAFVMKHEHYDFVEAVTHIAKDHNIHFEPKKYTDEEKQEIEKERNSILSIYEINRVANEFYKTQFLESKKARQIAWDKLPCCWIHRDFEVGYAPRGSQNLYLHLKEKGYEVKLMLSSGLIKKGENKNFDVFQDRLIFPINNIAKNIVGFGGKYIGTLEDAPKYINTSETIAYHKSAVLYGLNLSVKGITEFDYVNLVEGYTDVMMMHLMNANNTVATCGTAVTLSHINQIKRFTKTINLMLDGDNAGINASLSAGKEMLESGCHVSITPLPLKSDPCEYFRPAI